MLDSDSDVPLVSRGRFNILSTESDNDEEDVGQSMAVAAATGCAGDCDRVAVPMEDNGRRRKRLRISQATTVAIPPESFVDLTQRDVSGSDTPSLQRNAPRPTRRLTLVGVRPGSTMYAVEQSTTSGAETSEVASNFEDEGSNASGEEDAEVPIVEEEVEHDSAEEDVVVSEAGEMAEEEAEVEEVPFRLPGVATLRAAFFSLDVVRLTEEFEERASVMKSVPRFFEGQSARQSESNGLGLNSWTSGICQSCFRSGPL